MLTYDKYLELGGNLEEDDFPLFLTHANMKLDFITANKWSEFDYEKSDIALKCELLLTKVMNLLQEQDTHKQKDKQHKPARKQGISFYRIRNCSIRP